MRIKGVVKAQQIVQGLLAEGSEASRKAASTEARRVVDEIDAICESSGSDPAGLPTPSRKAYLYLSAIANGESHLSAMAGATVAARRSTGVAQRDRNLRIRVRELGRTMWRRRHDAMRDKSLRFALEDRIRQIIDDAGTTPDAPPAPGEPLELSWLRFLLQRDHLKRALKALDRAERAVREAAGNGDSTPEIIMLPLREVWAEVQEGPPLAWHISSDLFNAPKKVWRSLAHAMVAKDESSIQLVEAFLSSPACDQYRKLMAPPSVDRDDHVAVESHRRKAPAAPEDSRLRPIPTEAERNDAVERLRARPHRRLVTWAGGIARMPMWDCDYETPRRAYLTVLVECGTGRIQPGSLGTRDELDSGHLLLSAADVAESSRAFGGYRPGRVVVDDPELAADLKEPFAKAEIDIECREYPPEMRVALDQIYGLHEKEVGPPYIPGVLEPKGMTIDRLRRFADAAHAFHVAAPWCELTDQDLLEVTPNDINLPQLCLTGNAGISQGLVFTASPESTRRDPDAVSVTFDPPWRTPPRDVDLFTDEGIPVHDEAYPFVARISQDRIRRLSPRHTAFVEGVMRALAATTAEEIDSGVWKKCVQTADGPRDLEFTFNALVLEDDAEGSPSGGLANQPSLAEQMKIMQSLIESGHSPERLNEMIAGVDGGLSRLLEPGNATTNRADEILDRAIAARGRRRVQLAREVLAIDPDCNEAHGLLGQHLLNCDPSRAIEHFDRAIEAAWKTLEPEIKSERGHFWQFVETRPLMRSLSMRAACLTKLERHLEAREKYEEILELNRRDNMGVRFDLVGHLLQLTDHDAARALAKRFADDATCLWEWVETLIVFREEGDSPASRALLRKADKSNRHFTTALFDELDEENPTPGAWSTGEANEAEMIDGALRTAWRRSSGAMEWLGRRSGRR